VLTINWDRSTRLKNIEETEKAKRVVAEDRKGRPKLNNDEEHLAASRCEPYLVLFSGTVGLTGSFLSLSAKSQTKI
jgi:hypothetical protein